MRTVYIVGGVALAGGALWYLTTRRPAAPPVVPVTPGVTSGVSTFNKICRPIASAGLQAGAASQGAPPTATAGIATQAASLLCDLDSAVIKYAGKGIVYAGKAVATVAVDVAKGAAFLGKGVATGAVDTAKAVATGAVAVEHVAVAVAKAPVAVVTTVATAGKTVVTSVGGAVGGAASSAGHAIASVFSW
jgi:hypothetical protein